MIRFHARWVIPVGAPPIHGGTVVVDGDRIVWVGPRRAAPAGSDEDLGDAILLPGLVNTHVHLDLAAFDGAIATRDFFPWLRTLVGGLDAVADDAARNDSAHWSVADQLAHGVTTIGHTGPGRESFDAMRALSVRGVAFLETFAPDPALAEGAIASIRERVEDARADETSLVRVGVSPHAPYSVSDDLYRGVAAFARERGVPMAVHIAESRAETDLVRDAAGEFAVFLRGRAIAVSPRATSPVALLEATGVLAERPLCIHAIRVDADDVQRVARAGASVAHCPRSNAWFGHGVAPVGAFRAAGVAVGLGTDSIASNDAVRILAEARAAADDTLTPADRIDLVTRGGARALGLGDRVGTLAPSMHADLTAFAVRDPAVCDADPARYLLEQCAGDAALVTVVAGVVCARNGRVLVADDGIENRMREHRERVRRWAAALA